MKKLAFIALVTLATVLFTQYLSAQGLIISQPPTGCPSGQPWPPMPTVDETHATPATRIAAIAIPADCDSARVSIAESWHDSIICFTCSRASDL
jgi:hypothetical protein